MMLFRGQKRVGVARKRGGHSFGGMSARGILIAGVLLGGLGAGTPPHDPVQVYYPAGQCETGVLEIELWHRASKAWRPHPDHPRIMAGTCQLEDAGDLLNEIRVRCADPANPARASEWVTGVQVYQPADAPGCGPPALSLRQESSPQITLLSPPADRPVSSVSRTTPVRGQVRLNHDVLLLVDRALFAPPGDAILDPRLLTDALQVLAGHDADRLGPLRIGWLAFQDPALPASDSGSEAVSWLKGLHSFDQLKVDLARSEGAAGTPGWAQAMDQAITALQKIKTPEDRQTILSIAPAASAYPLGLAAGSDPVHRQNVLSRVDRAAQAGVSVHLLVLGIPERDLPELARQVREQIGRGGAGGGVAALPNSDALSPSLLALRVLSLREVRVENLATGGVADPLEWDAGGHFSGDIPLQNGRNLLRVRVLLSSGEDLVADFDRRFDPAAIREKLRAEERARLQQTRSGRVSISVEESP